MLADEININNKSLISYIFARRNINEQMNKSCTLDFEPSSVQADRTQHTSTAESRSTLVRIL